MGREVVWEVYDFKQKWLESPLGICGPLSEVLKEVKERALQAKGISRW